MSALDNRISALELELASLRAQKSQELSSPTFQSSSSSFERYGRQLILPSFGASAQAKLSSLKVLVIGCGGLGCPAATYLAGAGVGSLTLVDDDVVSLSNLHRQVAHAEAFSFGNPVLKAISLASFLSGLNSSIEIKTVCERFSAKNGLSLALAHDVIVDASDNAASRYLINDAAVLAGKPLVSGAALGSDGQVSVYHFNDGPCYRCVFPVAPHPSASRSCADAGVLGPIAGVIGSLQALEVMKIAAELARKSFQQSMSGGVSVSGEDVINSSSSTTTTTSLSSSESTVDNFSRSASALLQKFVSPPHTPSLGSPLSGNLLVFDGSEARVRVAKLGKKRPECAVCGTNPAITSLTESESWSSVSCLAERDDPKSTSLAVEKSSTQGINSSGTDLKVEIVPNSKLFDYLASSSSSSSSREGLVLLDVRSTAQFAIESLPGAINIPLAVLRSNFSEVNEALKSVLALHPQKLPILCLCRRGNDSKHAARMLTAEGIQAVSVEGGMEAYLKSQGKKPY
jgi:adenylyltransferase/sulfurtransferase